MYAASGLAAISVGELASSPSSVRVQMLNKRSAVPASSLIGDLVSLWRPRGKQALANELL